MFKPTKLSILITVVLMLAVVSVALAQDTPVPEPGEANLVAEELSMDETVEASDLEIAEPRLLPDSKFYFLKNWERGIRSAFTFNPVKKAELKLKYASERLLEIEKLADKEKRPEILEKASEKYKEEIEKLKETADKIKEKAGENPKVAEFLDKFIQKTILQEKVHEGILKKLEEKVAAGKFSQEVLDKIETNTERHLEKFGEVMQKLEDKEQIKARIENNLGKIKGSEFKGFKDMQILKRMEEKAPEEIKEKIMETREGVLNEFQQKIENLPPEKQEKLQDYVEKVEEVAETKMEILEDIKMKLQEKPQVREKLEGVQEKIIERVREKVEEKTGQECPINMINPLACKGRVIVTKDENNCPVPRCIELGEGNIKAGQITPSPQPQPTETATTAPALPAPVPESPETGGSQRDCISLWDPVCGKNNRTYSNPCWAEVAGAEVAYKGVCKEATEEAPTIRRVTKHKLTLRLIQAVNPEKNPLPTTEVSIALMGTDRTLASKNAIRDTSNPEAGIVTFQLPAENYDCQAISYDSALKGQTQVKLEKDTEITINLYTSADEGGE